VEQLVLAASGAVDARGAGLLGDLASAREAGLAPELWFRLLFQWLFRPGFFADPRRVTDSARLAAAYPYPQPTTAFRAQLAAAVEGAPFDGHRITAPTLILCGALDLLIAPAASRASFADLTGVRWCELADAAHSLHWDQPAAFAAAVTEFLTVGRAAFRR
jgi:aminoacrylate hydrolase